MQKKVWFLRDICFDEFKAKLYRPWYKADNVNKVKPMLKIAEVLVKAALSNVPVESVGNGANKSAWAPALPPLVLSSLEWDYVTYCC